MGKLGIPNARIILTGTSFDAIMEMNLTNGNGFIKYNTLSC